VLQKKTLIHEGVTEDDSADAARNQLGEVKLKSSILNKREKTSQPSQGETQNLSDF
jgi:hypothetical protein